METVELTKDAVFTDIKDAENLELAIESVVKKKGYEHIKANIEGYDQPTSFVNSRTGNEYIPDITAERFGKKSYFEVAIKNNQVRKLVNKWELLSNLANMKKGKFHLLAPRGHFAFTQRLCAKHNIMANIIKL